MTDTVVPDRPKVVDDLDVNELEDGVVVFVGASDTVHHLNNTAAIVLHLCDGTRDATAISVALQEVFDLDEPPLAETLECLRSLSAQDMLVAD